MRSALFICLGATLIAQNNTSDRSAEIGRQLVEEVRRMTTPIELPAVQDYVEKLGARLDADATFSVMKSHAKGREGPIAMRGGYIFVPVGSLLAVEDEAELAGILAQAIVRARKPIQPIMTPGTLPLFLGPTVSTVAVSGCLPRGMRTSLRQMQLPSP
jgi:hypothetical protein